MAIYYSAELQAGGNFPLIDSDAIRGGYRSVNTLEELNQIDKSFVKEGMLCFVANNQTFYRYNRNFWIETKINNNSGVPILTKQMEDELGSNIPDKYIKIPDDKDLNGPVTNNTITITNNGNYIDILFSAIRKLQSEVARLKNSFRYGINSYTNTATAMSTVLNDNKNIDEEPLWAIEENDLSQLIECTFEMGVEHPLVGEVVADLDNKLLYITQADFIDPEKGFSVQPDPKSFLYLTADSKQISIEFGGETITNIDLNTLDFAKVSLYNIMILVSKKTTKDSTDPTLYGDNYIWISIQDAHTDKVLIQGYYNNSNVLSKSKVQLSTAHYISKISFNNLKLYKFNSYTKAQDFSSEVIPNIPNDENYKFGVAHLTIRSIQNNDMLKQVINQLQNNELIWIEATSELLIKSKGKIYNIGSNKHNNNNMTIEELIANLNNLGIIITNNQSGDYDIKLANLSGITFIHQETGKKFRLEVDSEGKLRSTLEDTDTLKKRLEGLSFINSEERGFVSKLRIAEANRDGASFSGATDVGLLSDRIKIGAIYSPIPGRTVYGCSHAYIELENSSDKDFNLTGCYLHMAYKNKAETVIKTLPLTGTLKAGSTYLIRCKQYANFKDKNTVIKVKTFDQEWYDNGQLLDLQKEGLHLLLIYNTPTTLTTVTYAEKYPGKKSWKIKNDNLIDAVQVRDKSITSWVTDLFSINDAGITRDYILKNTYELDPAKQAFQALCEKDSSRTRGTGKNDFKPLYIDVDTISFPHSSEEYPVNLFTPKASFENKNISTDKSKLNTDRPNMVYCSFGINMHTTRCFNWVSVGSFNEYVWIRKKGTQTWTKFESYSHSDSPVASVTVGDFTRKGFSAEVNNAVYARIQGRFPGDNSFYTVHKCIIETTAPVGTKQEYEYMVGRDSVIGKPDLDHISKIMMFTIYPENTEPRIYQTTDQQGFYWLEYQTWAGSAKALFEKIESDLKKETFIPIIINTGDMTQNGTRVNEWLDYYNGGSCLTDKYEHMSVVGNNDLCGSNPDLLGTGDDSGKSNSYYHFLFQCFEIPDNTDLIINGKYAPSTYYFECKVGPSNYERIIGINSEFTFINCKEWFKLTTSDPDIVYNIYTGWTTGNTIAVQTPEYTKSFTPIYNTLYKWLSEPGRRCITACHEMPFTVMTRQNLTVDSSNPGYTNESRSVDGKVGGALIGSHLNQLTKVDNTAMYWFSRLLEAKGVKLCIGGHKHTYTCSYPVREFYFYANGTKNSLKDGPMPMGPDLSDEFANGKHKVTWKYIKKDDSLLISNNGKFKVPDGTYNAFISDNLEFNTSRLPIVKFSGTVYKVSSPTNKAPYTNSELSSVYLPIIGNSTMDNGVVYFMCQATGYKQTSNKELPGSAQAFTQLLPLTTYNSEKNKDEASPEQQLPMFGIVKYKERLTLQLVRVINVQISKKHPLYNNPGDYSTLPVSLEYINCENSDYIKQHFGEWSSQEANIISI